jgi:uncharacterized repeat protein (TIGR01451 family)
MKHRRAATWVTRLLSSAAIFAVAGACSSGGTPESTAGQPSRDTKPYVFMNGDFESGTTGTPPPDWVIAPFINGGITVQTPQTYAGLDLMPGGKSLTYTLVSGTGPLTQPDSDLGTAASLRWPRYGNQCVIVNQHSSTNFTTNGTKNGQNVNVMSQTMQIAAGDVDPADGKVHVRFVVAPVLQNPAHMANQQPYYLVQLIDLTQGNALLYSDFNLSGAPGIPWKTIASPSGEIDYTDWQLVDISPTNGSLAMGDMVELQIVAAGCSPGGHFGEIYVDGVGSTVPGLFVSGTGPAQVNPCGNITYTLTYENGGTTPAAGVQVIFNTPPQTTFVSDTAPAGVVCSGLIPLATGALTCNVAAPLAAGASGSFQITVAESCIATGIITAGDYSVQATGVTPLLGPHINTIAGCIEDSECPTGDWCNESGNACTAKRANGNPIPTDPPHTSPTLSGTCSAAAGTLTCSSGVCDTDNDCGYKNGDGTCVAGTGVAVCRSGVCDTDTKCGYANGDGSCTVLNAGTVCRSGICGQGGKCIGIGGCTEDADCALVNEWCNESTSTCTAKVANNGLIPTDNKHSETTLNGTCTTTTGTLTCVSGVCDTKDNRCGYANSDGTCALLNAGVVCRSGVCDLNDTKCGLAVDDGPCTAGNGATICRSGACSDDLTCEPAGGCDVDEDCAPAQYCDTPSHTCTAKVANGSPVPSVPGHNIGLDPTLDGMCSPIEGADACLSLVCDTKDNDCGYADGDGPCSVATGPTVCRSGTCSPNAPVCIPAGGCAIDTDCTSAQDYCDTPSQMCVPKVPNSSPVPTVAGHVPTLDGTCSLIEGADACLSGVCDTVDNDCGYANGDGPCDSTTAATVCRSTTCSANLTCVASGGCNVDADCSPGNWCNETAHMCTPTLVNGQPLPTDAAHSETTLNGTCTTTAGALTCASGVCDTKDNACGYANGDGPCTGVNGAVDCRSGTCATTGANAGLCVGCVSSASCTTAPDTVCNLTSGNCVQCIDSTTCPSETPVCDVASSDCAACNGDFGSTSTEACSTMDAPFCFLTGSTAGQCGKCSTNADCTGHSGSLCDTTSGLCTNECATDKDCLASQWCDAVSPARGTCEAKLTNGTKLPTTPTTVATCTTAVGARVCLSTVCDSKDNTCGFEVGDGPCTSTAECDKGTCQASTKTCQLIAPPVDAGVDSGTDSGSDAGHDAGEGCKKDDDCTSGNYCTSAHACAPTLPEGATCTLSSQCQSDLCNAGICSVVISSGNGVACSVQEPGRSGESSGAGVFGLGLAFAGVAARRRRRAAARA